MELNDYMRVLRRHWVSIVAFTLLGLLAAGAMSLMIRPTYAARTQLFVAIQSSGSVSELQQGNSFSQARVQSYVETATTPVVLQPVVDSLGLDLFPEELASKIEASADFNTVIISITAADSSPVQAAAIAQAVADSLVNAIEQLESPAEGGTSPVRLSVITPASAPATPSAPNVPTNIALGFLCGLFAGVGISITREVLDTKVRNAEDLRRICNVPVLGGISFDSTVVKKPLLTHTAAQSPRAESFRQIRTNLQFAQVDSSTRAVLVTSSLPGEGKSTTAINMAIAMAEAGRSVVLVDADLRRPRLNEYMGLDRNAGLTTAIVGATDLEELLQPWGDDNLFVLTSGQIPPNPSELLGSEAMRALIARMEQTFDTVIIDAPPLLPVTDAAVLAQQVGGVVLVVGASQVTAKELTKSLASLEMVGANILGAVLNLLPAKGPDAYAYSYSYSSIPESADSFRTERARKERSLASGQDSPDTPRRPAVEEPRSRSSA